MVFTRDKCSFFNCVSTRLDLNACKFFNFCKHDYKKWLQVCNNENLKAIPVTSLIRNYGVCQKHFKNNCFQQKLSPIRNKLNHNAVPENICNEGKFIGIPYRYLGILE